MEDWQKLSEEIRFDSKKALKLIAKGFGIKTPPDAYESPLVTSARRGELEVVVALLAKGADAHATRKGADTPLLVALKGHHAEVAKALWPKSPVPTREYFGTDDALQTRTHAGVDALIEAQLGPTPRPAGLTRLHVGVLSGDVAVVEQALAAGVDASAKTTLAFEVRAPGTREKVKLRAGLTAASLATALAKVKGAAALLAPVEALLAGGKKKTAKKPTRVRVPVVAGGPHAGLRAVTRLATDGLFRPLILTDDDYQRDEVELSDATIDVRALGLFEARFENAARGLTADHLAGAQRVLSRSIKALEAAGPGVWRSTSLLKKSGVVAGKAAPVEASRAGERDLVVRWVKAMVGGADATDFLLEATRRTEDALAAARLLRQVRNLQRPAWFYVPTLEVPDAVMDRLEGLGDGRLTLWDAAREAAVTTRLMELTASKDLDLAETAAASLPEYSELEQARHPTWSVYSAAQREALGDALIALLERCQEDDGRVPLRSAETRWVPAARLLMPKLKKARTNPFGKVTEYSKR